MFLRKARNQEEDSPFLHGHLRSLKGEENLMTERGIIWVVFGVLVVLLLGPLLDGLGWGGGGGPGWMVHQGVMGPGMMWGWRGWGGPGFYAP